MAQGSQAQCNKMQQLQAASCSDMYMYVVWIGEATKISLSSVTRIALGVSSAFPIPSPSCIYGCSKARSSQITPVIRL